MAEETVQGSPCSAEAEAPIQGAPLRVQEQGRAEAEETVQLSMSQNGYGVIAAAPLEVGPWTVGPSVAEESVPGSHCST